MTLPPDLYTASQVRELDSIVINHFGIAGFTLMKRAGQATFDAAMQAYPVTQSVCIVCGGGNNGGDGYVIATCAIEKGLDVNLIVLGNTNNIKGDALLAREAYLQAGGKESAFEQSLLATDMIVDALFGTGLSREITEQWKTAIEAINASKQNRTNYSSYTNRTNNSIKSKIIAVDIPSGLNADTGRVHGVAVEADLTVTYIGLKCGLFTGQARDYTGKIVFNDLQVPKAVYHQLSEPSNKQLIPKNFLQQVLKPRSRSSHKGHYGHVLLIGGTQGMSGAIRLAAEACLRVGAGLVSVATDPSHADLINISRPELMVTGVSQEKELQPLLERASVIVIGPGLGQSSWAKALLQETLKSDKPKVLDADALNLLSSHSNQLRIAHNSILTPHPAEAARLLGVNTAEIEKDRYQSILRLAKLKSVKKGGGGYVLKGAGTLVSDGEKTYVCSSGNPGMASGGMGDVLSGLIAGLMAQGLNQLDAAIVGTQIHAQAADLAAQKGERGLLVSDLFPYIRLLVNEKMNEKNE